ncbi:hypothetical protein PLESTB_001095800 [Pleodorina starrii]|uniref:Uncharacterized protein n=1 Tax=Pleodorina starrii TaxID=330485 RepID=A0A9W6F5C2_9CHLO|nr:hypothetical protein PLESTM_001330500 [Pleodorina starrii]GLC56355.1 hypothetical protein PLESTB_001095800 [Pleodorina starrii]GLC69269.1 hypothetical protein PLESTF_000809800 [Pleodorina starrii]
MPAHQVGSLDAWLGSPFANGGIGVPAIQFFQGQSTRSRSFRSGPSRPVPMAERKPANKLSCAVDAHAGSDGEGEAVQLASTSAAMEIADASLSPATTIDNLLDRSYGFCVSPRMATSPKRKSLLSEQLRTASSLPLAAWHQPHPKEADGENDGNVIMYACRSLGSAQAGNRDYGKRLGANLQSTSASLDAPSTARWLLDKTIPAINNHSPEAQGASPSAEAGSLDLQVFPVGGGLSGLSDGSRGSGSGGGGGGSAGAESRFRNASYGSKLLVLGSMDADASSACGGGGGSCSLACSSSAGCYSSGSNVLQYYSCRDRDDCCASGGCCASGEQLECARSLLLSHPAVSAAAVSVAATGAGAADGAVRMARRARSPHPKEQQQCPDGLLERPAARKPSSLPQPGTATDALSLSTALSSPSPCGAGAFPASSTATTTTSIAFATGGASEVSGGCLAADDDEDDDDEDDTAADDDDPVDARTVCSATDLVSSTLGTTDSGMGCTAVRMAVATHLASAPLDVAAVTEPGADSAAAATPPAPPFGPLSPLPLSLPDLEGAGSPAGGSATAAVAAVAAKLLGTGDGSSGDGALAGCEEKQQQQQQPVPAAEQASHMSVLSLRPPSQLEPADVPQPPHPGGEAPGKVGGRPPLERHWSEALPAGLEGSRRGGRGVSYASLFSTVIVLPAGGGSGGGGGGGGATAHLGSDAAADPYNAGVCLQHSLSMGSVAGRRGDVWSGHGADGADGAAASDAWLRDLVNARRSFDVSKTLSRGRAASGAEAGGSRGGSRGGSIHELLEADVAPAMYEGTVRRGLPRRAAPLSRTMSQPVTEEMLRSCLLDSAEGIDAAAAAEEDAARHD